MHFRHNCEKNVSHGTEHGTNPNELLSAYISGNGFLYISTTHAYLFVLTMHHFYSKRLSGCNLVCVSHKRTTKFYKYYLVLYTYTPTRI